jgi:hypothetical protein
MTTTKKIHSAGAVIIWPEHGDDADFQYEHAIAVVPYSDSIGVEQNGQSITIPLYALRQVMAAIREAAKEAEAK